MAAGANLIMPLLAAPQHDASSSQLNIGDDPTDTSPGQGHWDGKIDDLAIWTRALSSSELTGIYNAGLAGRPLLTSAPEPSAMALAGVGAPLLVLLGIAKRPKLARDASRSNH
jgi:hypothetical protein